MYDLIIKNGRVIDHSCGFDGKKDIYIKDGVFVLPDEKASGQDADKIIDAKGCIVTPGIIDSHIHVFDSGSYDLNVNADIACIPNGVTTCIDAGSTGPLTFESFYRGNIAYSMTTIKSLLHVSFNGIYPAPYPEIHDPASFDEKKIKRLFRMFGGCLVGLKVRQHSAATHDYGVKPLERTVELAREIEAEGIKCNVTVHVTDPPNGVEMEDIVELLRPGDVFAHTYQNRGKNIIGADGKVLTCLKEAKKRGIAFDSACAGSLFALEKMIPAFEQGFYPDIIGTDTIGRLVYKRPLFTILNQMSMFMNLGMKLEEIIKTVTWTPAKLFAITGEAGTLNPGCKADVAILQIWDHKTNYRDMHGQSFEGNKIIVPIATIKNGRTAFEQIFHE